MLNVTVLRLTAAGLLARRRAVFALAAPALAVVLAIVFRLVAGTDRAPAVGMLQWFVLGAVVPLAGLLAGTAAIRPEIDDGSIVYLLAKPVPRHRILLSKLVVAGGLAATISVVSALLAAVIMLGWADRIAPAVAVAALVTSLAYCAAFLMLAVLTGHGVALGLIYVLLWESLVAGLSKGAQALSIRQWGLAVAERVMGTGADAPVRPGEATPTVGDLIGTSVGAGTAGVLLVVVAAGAAVLATGRLKRMTLSATVAG